jgi:chromosome condensin MukBEF MukE localization factor
MSCAYDNGVSVDKYVEIGDFSGVLPHFYKKYDRKVWKSQKNGFFYDEKKT